MTTELVPPTDGGRYLVLLHTSGNQRYIFATNKRRENVGASDLVTRVGTTWVDEALPQGVPVQVLTRTSGKALLLLDSDREVAMELVFKVTRRALEEAPGLDVAGVVRRVEGESLAEASQAIHREFQAARSARPGPEGRFPQLPFLERCTSSGLPAAGRKEIGSTWEPRSAPAMAKLDGAEGGFDRIARVLGLTRKKLVAVAEYLEGGDGTGELQRGAGWVGVIHADGNGLGSIFRTLGGGLSDADFAEQTRKFSEAIEKCTLWAFQAAIKLTWPGEEDPRLLPLVLGGDDVTALCDGPHALDFTINYLRSFEAFASTNHAEPAQQEAAAVILQVANGPVTACAGVAIVKPHFPFSEAHQLAIDLASSAKMVKQRIRRGDGSSVPCSAIDFHVLYDASAADCERIREALRLGDDTSLTAKPYVVTEPDLLEAAGAVPESMAWAHRRRVAVLRQRSALLARRQLPSSPAHDLRGALRIDREVADQRFRVLCRKHDGLDILGDGEGKLFWNEGEADAPSWVTGYLDALEVAQFLSPDPEQQESGGPLLPEHVS